jgi:flavin-dependent dehydrogenase
MAEPGGLGHVLDRPAFDRMLAAAVAATGVVSINDGVIDARRHDGLWRLGLAGGGVLDAVSVLDCSGRRAVLARHLSPQRRADRLVAACAFLTQTDTDIEPSPATLIEAAPDGWWYAALLPDRRLAIAFFSDPDLLPRGLSRDPAAWRDMVAATRFISEWIASAGFALGGPPVPHAAGTAWLTRAAGPGWAAAGDAALSVDPLSAHGMTTALWTGRRAAQAMMAGGSSALENYADTVATAINGVLGARARVYGVSRYRDRVFWRRRDLNGLGV